LKSESTVSTTQQIAIIVANQVLASIWLTRTTYELNSPLLQGLHQQGFMFSDWTDQHQCFRFALDQNLISPKRISLPNGSRNIHWKFQSLFAPSQQSHRLNHFIYTEFFILIAHRHQLSSATAPQASNSYPPLELLRSRAASTNFSLAAFMQFDEQLASVSVHVWTNALNKFEFGFSSALQVFASIIQTQGATSTWDIEFSHVLEISYSCFTFLNEICTRVSISPMQQTLDFTFSNNAPNVDQCEPKQVLHPREKPITKNVIANCTTV